MNAPHLIDAIVRQTTVLIAHLATAAGVRAPPVSYTHLTLPTNREV